ncbi:2-phospho-L-lactate transferase [Methanocella arvoryzae]|uniref:2-phospho-L-lactate transferase n=1 Tax=Methanocella arvoryzae (strain DSM 22066 / NBRC 105507 / MRE50) TaxID=351160 RepID=Q0W0E0_METAR|nr:2-phospho-L-lactate transferase [Methanocella arvoryzae]CAJ38153.1 LPPG:Fo 2-phopspho-L-lactate transferase [Methanocella arvoryzae MRE50]
MFTVLSGGTGTPKLLRGFKDSEDLAVVVNTAEDIYASGNKITPDIDSVIYTIAGVIDDEKWWGIRGDTFNTYNALKAMGHYEELMIGDKDRATHIIRTELLRYGSTLTEATLELCDEFEIKTRVLPMSEEDVTTVVSTPEGDMHFQDFWITFRGEPEVKDVRLLGALKPTDEVMDVLGMSENIIIGPSNPITSIGPILALEGVRDALQVKFVVAVSPFIGDRPISGPAAKLMKAKGFEPSTRGVAECYKDIVDVFIMDKRDNTDLSRYDFEVDKFDTLMTNAEKSKALADFVLSKCV